MTDIDPTTIGAIIGSAAAMCSSLIYVGRKVERVDQRLGRLESELAEAKEVKLEQRVIVLEQQVSDVKSRCACRPKGAA